MLRSINRIYPFAFSNQSYIYSHLRLLKSQSSNGNQRTHSSSQYLRLSSLDHFISLPIDRLTVLTIISLSKDTNQRHIPYLRVCLGHVYSFNQLIISSSMSHKCHLILYLIKILESLSILTHLELSQALLLSNLPGFLDQI